MQRQILRGSNSDGICANANKRGRVSQASRNEVYNRGVDEEKKWKRGKSSSENLAAVGTNFEHK